MREMLISAILYKNTQIIQKRDTPEVILLRAELSDLIEKLRKEIQNDTI